MEKEFISIPMTYVITVGTIKREIIKLNLSTKR
jgi:hypothetical protein